MSQDKNSQHDPLREDVERRQQNTVWPNSMRNAANVDGYLWKGNPKAPAVQRIGAVIFGLVFSIFGAAFFVLGVEERFWPLCLVALAFGYVGFRMLRNAFRRE